MSSVLNQIKEFLEKVKNKEQVHYSEIRLIQQFMKECSEAFYTTSEQLIPNGIYDELRHAMRDLGVEVQIGARPDPSANLKEGVHSFSELVGSLTDVTSPDEIVKKIREIYDDYNAHAIRNNLPVEEVCVRATLKYDGNSITLYYDPATGYVTQALTRGEGDVGVDLTPVFKDKYLICPFSPENYNGIDHGTVAIKFEAVVLKSKLALLNEALEKAGRKPYLNCRTAISGILHRSDAAEYSQYVDLFPIELRSTLTPIAQTSQGVDSEHGYHKLYDLSVLDYHIDEQNYLKVDEYFCFADSTVRNPDLEGFVKEIYEEVQKIRNDLDFMIDGVVIEVLNPAIRQYVGWASGCPKYSFALKFPYFDQLTTVTDMEYDFGYLTGRITPCVRFEPVIHNNCKFDRVSLANYKRFKELNLGKGSPVLFEYRMDTLGYIEGLPKLHDTITVPFEFIKNCPICNSELEFPLNRDGEQVYAYCRSNECIGNRIGKFIKIFELTSTKGIAESTLRKLIEAGKLTSFASMFMLKPEDIVGIDGLGEVSAKSIVDSVQSILPLKDWMLIAGLPIEGIGKSKATAICSKILLLDLLNCQNVGRDIIKTITDLNIEGIGDLTAESIANGIEKYREEILEVYGNFDVQGTVINADALRICITGGIKYPGKRNALNKLIASKGHVPVDDVTKTTSYLVCNSPSSSSKYKNAEKHGIPIISEEYLINEILSAKD